MQAMEEQYPARKLNDQGDLYFIHQPQYFKMENAYVELKYSTNGINAHVTVSRGGKVLIIVF